MLSSQATPAHLQQEPPPRVKLTFFDYQNAPFTITKVLLANKEISSGELILATDDWAKHLIVEGVNKSNKAISYISYALDFTISGEDSLYRLKLDIGEHYFKDGRKSIVQISKGQKAMTSISDKVWDYSSSIVSKINQKKLQITKAELSLEAVYFEDDRLFTFGSWLKRSSVNPSTFIGIGEKENVIAQQDQAILRLSRNSFTKNYMIKPVFANCYTWVVSTTIGQPNRGTRLQSVTQACNPNSNAGSGTICTFKSVQSPSGQGDRIVTGQFKEDC